MFVYDECFNTVQIAHACLQRIFQCGRVYLHFTYSDIYLYLLHALPPFDKHYQMSPSSSSMAMSFNRHFTILAAVRFGRNSVADGFNSFFFSSSFVVVIPSQCNSNAQSS